LVELGAAGINLIFGTILMFPYYNYVVVAKGDPHLYGEDVWVEINESNKHLLE
jgi:hypothetical protein